MKKRLCVFSLVFLLTAAGGCAITDYSGYADHKTSAEAKLLGTEISLDAGPTDPLTGTYSHTVKYDNRGGQGTVTIVSYRNEVPSSFSRDGQIDRDGDDIQGNGGILGGTFLKQWVAVDSTGGAVCEFSDNITFSKGGVAPLVSVCQTTNEEVDKDWDLHADFADLNALASFLWNNNGASSALEVTSLSFDGVDAPIEPLAVDFRSNGLRPIELSVNGTTEAFDSFLQAILSHTDDRTPVALELSFAGGLSIGTPGGWQVAFDHGEAQRLLNR